MDSLLMLLQQNLYFVLLTVLNIAADAVWLYFNRKKLDINIFTVLLIAIIHSLFGLVCVRVFALIEGFGSSQVVGGMRLFGCVFFMPAFYYLVAKIIKKPIPVVFDILTICNIIGLFNGRINCLFAGCCIGKIIPGLNGIRFHTRESELLFYLILLIYLIKKLQEDYKEGTIYPIFMFTYSAFRFVNEFFRVSDKTAGMWHLAHIWCFIGFALGYSIYVEYNKKNKKRKGN